MIIIKLKGAMLAYERRFNRSLSCGELSEMTGIPADTLRSIASRSGYHTTVARIEILCRALDVTLGNFLEIVDDPPKSKRKKRKSKAKKKKS